MTATAQPSDSALLGALLGYARQVDPHRVSEPSIPGLGTDELKINGIDTDDGADPVDGSSLLQAAEAPPFDELMSADGGIRPGWQALTEGLGELAGSRLRAVSADIARLLEDDGVTYTPNPSSGVTIVDRSEESQPQPRPAIAADRPLSETRPWRLDPVPLVLDGDEWFAIERGLVQRAELLDAVLDDLYGDQLLLGGGHLPTAAMLGHGEYLRAAVGLPAESRRLFLLATDLGRDHHGDWKVTSDRTQAPSGAGYAMQNRRIVSRALPELYRESRLYRLTPFFHAMRTSLVDAAPRDVEDPRVVVLSPGTRSETAFDQAFLASLLGFPLLEGSDLTVRDGRVWMRVLGRLEQVDVILRRVDAVWADPLELRPGSRLGVAGLTECVRQGTVTVVNGLGSGVLENPALMPFLPDLCRRLLDEDLRLPSVQTYWCGDDAARAFVLAHLDSLVIRAIDRGHGRSVVGSALSADQRDTLVAAIERAPHRYVGQELLSLSSTPTAGLTSESAELVPRPVVLRSFAVRRGQTYTPMLGGLARVADSSAELRGSLVGTDGGGLSKDVWVVGNEAVGSEPGVPWARDSVALSADATAGAMVPRVLDDLFWLGRYAERAEDLLRLVLATRTVAVETDSDPQTGHALDVLLGAVTRVSGIFPGFTQGRSGPAANLELRRVVIDRTARGSVAQSVASLQSAAVGVRDQLSNDVWMVLAGIERALNSLVVEPTDRSNQLIDTSERVLSGLLALSGITSENMVRDPGWYLMDVGRGLERALQLTALMRHTCCTERDASAQALVVEAVLTASESIVTFRRRYRGYTQTEALVGLLVLDPGNPRSVRYQLDRIRTDLGAVPSASSAPRPLRLAEELIVRLDAVDAAALVHAGREHAGDRGDRPTLAEFLDGMASALRTLGTALGDHYLQQPPLPQPLVPPTSFTSGEAL